MTGASGDIQRSPTEFVFVDDDKLTLEIVSWITRKSTYSARLFMDAGEALAYLKKHPPALLIVDFYMPGLTGLEFIEELRSCVDLSQTATYLCSAVPPQGDVAALFDNLRVGILEKQVVCDRELLSDLLDQHLHQ
jgi:CheY-like chemotaxis protein